MERFEHKRPFVKSALIAAALFVVPSFVADAAPLCTKIGAQMEMSDDRRTTDEVERRIASDETLAPLAERIRVTTTEGVVTLRGVIASDEDRLVLASVAEGTPGVRRVEDRLQLR
ncbi:MAG: BON domain-containing protein [Candidatus Binatia bacterium]